MEASGAGLSGGDAGQGEGEGQGQGKQDGGLGFDPGQLMQQVQSLGSDMGGLREMLQGLQPQEQEQEPEGPDLSFLDPSVPGFDPDQIGPQLQQLVDERAQAQLERIVKEQLNPLQDGLQELKRERMVDALAQEFPEVEDPEVAQQLISTTSQLVQQHGWSAELANDPRMWRLTYLAGRAYDAHHREQEAPEQGAAMLEGGRGARPAQQQVDPGDQIVAGGTRRGASALPFS